MVCFRVCVNGREITDRTPLRHGNRLLIGMNHFFRVNCPKVSALYDMGPRYCDNEKIGTSEDGRLR